jgi:hypothetical protein
MKHIARFTAPLSIVVLLLLLPLTNATAQAERAQRVNPAVVRRAPAPLRDREKRAFLENLARQIRGDKLQKLLASPTLILESVDIRLLPNRPIGVATIDGREVQAWLTLGNAHLFARPYPIPGGVVRGGSVLIGFDRPARGELYHVNFQVGLAETVGSPETVTLELRTPNEGCILNSAPNWSTVFDFTFQGPEHIQAVVELDPAWTDTPGFCALYLYPSDPADDWNFYSWELDKLN